MPDELKVTFDNKGPKAIVVGNPRAKDSLTSLRLYVIQGKKLTELRPYPIQTESDALRVITLLKGQAVSYYIKIRQPLKEANLPVGEYVVRVSLESRVRSEPQAQDFWTGSIDVLRWKFKKTKEGYIIPIESVGTKR